MTNLSPTPLILFAEWLPTGVVVHFEQGASGFFSAEFLFDNRDTQPIPVAPDDDPED